MKVSLPNENIDKKLKVSLTQLMQLFGCLAHYLRPRLLHPVVAFIMVFCCSGLSSFGVPCSAACAPTDATPSLQSGQVSQSDSAAVSLSENCCSSSAKQMSCCGETGPIHDLLAVTINNLELRAFTAVLPNTFLAIPVESSRLASLRSACPTGQSQKLALAPCKIYIVNRQLLI